MLVHCLPLAICSSLSDSDLKKGERVESDREERMLERLNPAEPETSDSTDEPALDNKTAVQTSDGRNARWIDPFEGREA